MNQEIMEKKEKKTISSADDNPLLTAYHKLQEDLKKPAETPAEKMQRSNLEVYEKALQKELLAKAVTEKEANVSQKIAGQEAMENDLAKGQKHPEFTNLDEKRSYIKGVLIGELHKDDTKSGDYNAVDYAKALRDYQAQIGGVEEIGTPSKTNDFTQEPVVEESRVEAQARHIRNTMRREMNKGKFDNYNADNLKTAFIGEPDEPVMKEKIKLSDDYNADNLTAGLNNLQEELAPGYDAWQPKTEEAVKIGGIESTPEAPLKSLAWLEARRHEAKVKGAMEKHGVSSDYDPETLKAGLQNRELKAENLSAPQETSPKSPGKIKGYLKRKQEAFKNFNFKENRQKNQVHFDSENRIIHQPDKDRKPGLFRKFGQFLKSLFK